MLQDKIFRGREMYVLLFHISLYDIRFVVWYIIIIIIIIIKSHDSSVGIALGYGLDDRGSRVRFPVGVGNFSLHHRVQNGSGAHRASCPMDTMGSFPGVKSDGAWSWPLTRI
jgi:hypothetical protein